MSRYVYLVRHGEQQDAEHGLPDGPLSGRGQRQARAIAERLSGVPFASVHTSPLQRAVETASYMTELMPAMEPEISALLMDCIPTGPTADMPHAFESFFGGVTEEEIAAGEAQMADAVAEWLSPSRDDRHELLITHNFVIAWFVREVLQAPEWRWMTLNQAHCGLTVLAQKQGGPWTVLSHNDTAHLPVEMRTGLPEPYAF